MKKLIIVINENYYENAIMEIAVLHNIFKMEATAAYEKFQHYDGIKGVNFKH